MSFLRRLFGSDKGNADREPAAWPAEGEGPFDVEDEGGDWDFRITFDDVIANEEEDRVAAFVGLLTSQPGVREAAHEDREVILVKTRGLDQHAMQLAAERAWLAAGQGQGTG